MSELAVNINWIAVIAGTIISFLLGWVWYMPAVFGRKWAAGNNITLPEAGGKIPMAPMIIQLIATFLLAWVIAITAAQNALATAILILLTIAALIASNGLFAQKTNSAVVIESTFVLVMGIVMIICHAIF